PLSPYSRKAPEIRFHRSLNPRSPCIFAAFPLGCLSIPRTTNGRTLSRLGREDDRQNRSLRNTLPVQEEPMRRRLKNWCLCHGSVAALCLAGSLVRAEPPCLIPPSPPQACPTPPGQSYLPGGIVPPGQTMPPGMMGQPGGTGATGAEGGLAGTAETAFASLGAGAGVGSSAALAAPGGYIDNAIPKTMFG